MSVSRQEIANLRDVELQCRWDAVCSELRRDWMRGQPGRISSVFTMGLLLAESNIRGLPLRPLSEFEQIRLAV